MPEQPAPIEHDPKSAPGVTDPTRQGPILTDFVDYLMPLLRPYETTIYLYLLRRTILRGERETKVGLRTISKDCGVGTRSATGGNIQHIREVLDALAAKGCIEIGERTREGTAVTVITPSQVPGVADRMARSSCVPPAPLDYYRDPELRIGIFERDSWACHYCGEGVTSATATLDHLIPVSRGGPNTADNLVTCCLVCNSVKAGRTYEEAAALLLNSIRLRRKGSAAN